MTDVKTFPHAHFTTASTANPPSCLIHYEQDDWREQVEALLDDAKTIQDLHSRFSVNIPVVVIANEELHPEEEVIEVERPILALVMRVSRA